MISHLTKYLLRNAFLGHKKQTILILAVLSLAISSFALLVVQSTMEGLQKSLIERSINIEGHFTIELPREYERSGELYELLVKEKGIRATSELSIELLLKNGAIVVPVTLHGIDLGSEIPPFLASVPFDDLHMSHDLATKLNLYKGEYLQVISLQQSDSLLGEIPRIISAKIGSLSDSDVPEIDESHAWTRLSLVQNLLKYRSLNTIRIYDNYNRSELEKTLSQFDKNLKLESWNDRHSALSHALKLESFIMLFLFWLMVIFVAVTIGAGLTMFFEKIKRELTAFWILGSSYRELKRSHFSLMSLIISGSILSGVIMGTFFLFFIRDSGINLMPDVFVDKKIPVNFSLISYLMAFVIPYSIAFIVITSVYYLWSKKGGDFLKEIRGRTH